MKRRWKITGSLLFLVILTVLSVLQIRRVNAGYQLQVHSVEMGEAAYLQDYRAKVERAEIYTLEQYYKTYPEVVPNEDDKKLYQYVLVCSLELTKLEEDAPGLDLSDFVLRMGDSFNMFDPGEVTDLNGWTENQHLTVEEPFQVKLPYYISREYFQKKQWEHVKEMDYRLSWGVYPCRNELQLDRIEHWEEALGQVQEKEPEPEEPAEPQDERQLTGAEAYAAMMKEKGLTAENLKEPGEAGFFDGVSYEVLTVKQIWNVSEIPDYSEEYQPQPEWMKAGADVPVYTEEWDYRGDYLRKHNYILLKLRLTNETEEEKAPRLADTRLAYEAVYWEDVRFFSSENDYSTGGVFTYKDSYSDFVILQPGETKEVYALHDLWFDIDSAGIGDYLEDGQPTYFLSEEEAVLTDCLPLYLVIGNGFGGDLRFENKSYVFMELDWRGEDGAGD